ncbi:MBL fold metallo-hydrolase [Psychrobacillus lasiicapitis]|uniref:MBL fold metallo-hydrolase n=1 Tax=Psychrobacillus lasiicapitis TaxID=1636719 RepID=A0A544TGP7_9BACI|nr:MBL fold metallo-hydrolase [Psychrobacillus lasiicapitis]TQR16600.1 MBL fold metallo-hydrolase [Psychrobacillus lasiicapitis]GGA28827.1 MBL fold metallo-hydrolase [Psychrobacillus lasiicapitis]
MLTEVVDGIHKLVIKFPTGMGEVNCYLIEGKNGYTVIDTGTDSKEAKDGWREVLSSGILIEKVVLTHTHQDHIGLGKWFQQEVGVPVIVSYLGYEEMKKNRVSFSRDRLNKLIIKHGGLALPNKIEEDHSIYDFEPDGFFKNHQHIQLGEELYKAIWTPGHAPDHFCFYNENKKIMIIGDHVLDRISPVIGLWSGEEGNLLQDYLLSLKEVEKYPADIILPGHGDLIYDLPTKIHELNAKHEHRLQQVLQSLTVEGKTANQICNEVYGTVNIILSLSSFMATLTRLLYLESIGKVERMELDGIVSFKRKVV